MMITIDVKVVCPLMWQTRTRLEMVRCSVAPNLLKAIAKIMFFNVVIKSFAKDSMYEITSRGSQLDIGTKINILYKELKPIVFSTIVRGDTFYIIYLVSQKYMLLFFSNISLVLPGFSLNCLKNIN